MSILKKLLITFILIIFGVLLFKLMEARRQIKIQYGIEGFREGAIFSKPSQKDELSNVMTAISSSIPTVGISNITSNTNLPLNQFCIKGTYNTALTGNYINAEMVKYAISRGCRFLDFEVFSFNNTPYVAYTTNQDYSTIDSQNKDTLQNILSYISTNAFAAAAPNPKDPIFVHLRIKTNQTSLYNKIADVLDYVFKQNNQLYLDPNTGNAAAITGNTPLVNILGQVIIVLDKSYTPTYRLVSYLANYVNMESSGDTLYKYSYTTLSNEKYSTPHIHDDGITTDVTEWKLVMPDLTSNWFGITRNSIYYPMVLNYGAQIVLYPLYQIDMYLAQYETAFANNSSAFVPLSTMIQYLTNTIGNPNIPMTTDISSTPGATPAANILSGPLGALVPSISQAALADMSTPAGNASFVDFAEKVASMTPPIQIPQTS